MVFNFHNQDEALVSKFVKEYSERLYVLRKVYTIDASTVVDDLYNEAVTKVYKLVGSMLMYADTANEIDTLTKFGIDRKRDMVFSIPKVIADAVIYNGAPYVPTLQDIIDFNGLKYQILNIQEEKWFWQTDHPLFYTCAADKVQEDGSRMIYRE